MTTNTVHARTSIADAIKQKEVLQQEIDNAIQNFEFSTGLQVLAIDIKWDQIGAATFEEPDQVVLRRLGVQVEVHI